MNSISPKTAAIIIVIVLIGIGAYYFWGGSTVSNFAVVSTQTAPTESASDILVLSQQLKTVSIDPSIFSGPLFANLVDRSVPIQPEGQGRTNPFAQFGF